MKSWLIKNQTTIERLPKENFSRLGTRAVLLSPEVRKRLENGWLDIEPVARDKNGVSPDWVATQYHVTRSEAILFLKEKGATTRRGGSQAGLGFPLSWKNKNRSEHAGY